MMRHDLARQFAPSNEPQIRLRSATVTSVGASTATVTIEGVSIAGVRFSPSLSLTNGQVVQIQFDGPVPLIVRRLT